MGNDIDRGQTEDTYKTSTEQTAPSAEMPQKKKHSLAVIIIVVSIFVIIIPLGFLMLVVGISAYSDHSEINECIKYLEDKYGKNEDFSYVDAHGNGGSIIPNHIERYFTSKRNKQFKIIVDKKNNSFSDNYYAILYEKEFQDYFYEKFGRAFSDIIPFEYKIRISADEYPYLGKSSTPLSFNDAADAVEEHFKKESTFYVYLRANYTEIDANVLKDINISKIKDDVANIAKTNSINKYNQNSNNDNSISADIYAPGIPVTAIILNISMEGSEYTDYCPENLDATVRKEQKIESNTVTEVINTCTVELYSAR